MHTNLNFLYTQFEKKFIYHKDENIVVMEIINFTKKIR